MYGLSFEVKKNGGRKDRINEKCIFRSLRTKGSLARNCNSLCKTNPNRRFAVLQEAIDEGIKMLGAIIGDIAGSRFEFNNHISKNFELLAEDCFVTDDSIMTLAIAKAILTCEDDQG